MKLFLVGLPGGVIGELLILLSTIEGLKTLEEDDTLASLKTIEITQETVSTFFKRLLII